MPVCRTGFFIVFVSDERKNTGIKPSTTSGFLQRKLSAAAESRKLLSDHMSSSPCSVAAWLVNDPRHSSVG